MACVFEISNDGFPGLSLFSTNAGSCSKQTAVFLPSKHTYATRQVDVVLWFHGLYVKDFRQHLFGASTVGGKSLIREQVNASSKDVVVIAPFLGGPNSHNFYAGLAGMEAGQWGERYLDDVLAGLAPFHNPGVDKPPVPEIRNLMIACHSGGGAAMLKVVKSLGAYLSNLKACWGFDCLYGESDADNWLKWLIVTNPQPQLLIYYGPTTTKHSEDLNKKTQFFSNVTVEKSLTNDHYQIASDYFLKLLNLL